MIINDKNICFCDFDEVKIQAHNKNDAHYSKDKNILEKLNNYNRKVIKEIYEFEEIISC